MSAGFQWDTNLRANLRLWPTPSSNVAAIASQVGQPYDEAAFARLLTARSGARARSDSQAADEYEDGAEADTEDETGVEPATTVNTRAVRQTFEVMAYAGLVYRDATRLLATNLGWTVFAFLGLVPSPSSRENERPASVSFACEGNRSLMAPFIIAALSLSTEICAVWSLMLASGAALSNEELNRSMIALNDQDMTLDSVAVRIRDARANSDPTLIGPRAYKNEDYGTARQTDQRKAMNPTFLLAGGGGWIIDVGQNDELRRLLPSAIPMVEEALARPRETLHVSTDGNTALAMSDFAEPPVDPRRLS
jgi:hypothetical protein